MGQVPLAPLTGALFRPFNRAYCMLGNKLGAVRTVSGKQLVQRRAVRDSAGPAVGGGHSDIELGVRIGEPLRPSVVEVCQGPLLERGRGLLVAE